MYQVVKRDGKVVDFDIQKISDALTKAFEAVNRQYHPTVINMLALKVTSDFDKYIQVLPCFLRWACSMFFSRRLEPI